MSERRYADGYRKLRKADEPRRIAYEVLHEVATQGAPGPARRTFF